MIRDVRWMNAGTHEKPCGIIFQCLTSGSVITKNFSGYMFSRVLFSLIKYLPIGRVPLALFLLKLGVYPKALITFRHRDGFLMHLDLSDWVQLVIYLFGDYKYEASEIRLWKKWVHDADRVLDIGAHVGYYSLLAKSSNPELRIDVFEPSQKTFIRLEKNIRSNGWNICTHYMALGMEEGSITMNQPDVRNSGMNFMSAAKGSGPESVPLSTWDKQFPAAAGAEGEVIVKIDAEGAEHQILEGGRGYIRSQRPLIFIELLNSTLKRFGSDAGQVYDLMVPLGYSFYRLNEHDRLQKCDHGDEGEVLILIPDEKSDKLVR